MAIYKVIVATDSVHLVQADSPQEARQHVINKGENRADVERAIVVKEETLLRKRN